MSEDAEKRRVARCPSTHCERRGECASPHDCIVKSGFTRPQEVPPSNTKAWNGAARIAFVAMGKESVGRGRGREIAHCADQDPLAWWCLTELIMSFAEKYRER